MGLERAYVKFSSTKEIENDSRCMRRQEAMRSTLFTSATAGRRMTSAAAGIEGPFAVGNSGGTNCEMQVCWAFLLVTHRYSNFCHDEIRRVSTEYCSPMNEWIHVLRLPTSTQGKLQIVWIPNFVPFQHQEDGVHPASAQNFPTDFLQSTRESLEFSSKSSMGVTHGWAKQIESEGMWNAAIDLAAGTAMGTCY